MISHRQPLHRRRGQRDIETTKANEFDKAYSIL